MIARDGELPWHLPDELSYFRRTTLHKPVIMGRKTFDSIGRRPLPKRKNIVLTRQKEFQTDDESVVVTNNLEDALKQAQHTGSGECFVAGGAEIYSLALNQADRLYQTVIEANIDGDTFFPEFDESSWKVICSEIHAVDDRHDYAFEMSVLERVQ